MISRVYKRRDPARGDPHAATLRKPLNRFGFPGLKEVTLEHVLRVLVLLVKNAVKNL